MFFGLVYTTMLIQSWIWEVLLVIWSGMSNADCFRFYSDMRLHMRTSAHTYSPINSSVRFKHHLLHVSLSYNSKCPGIYTIGWWFWFYNYSSTARITIKFSFQLPVDLDFRFYEKSIQFNSHWFPSYYSNQCFSMILKHLCLRLIFTSFKVKYCFKG